MEKEKKKESKNDALWRKPIKIDSVDDEDPLAHLYRGREVGDKETRGREVGDKERKGKVVSKEGEEVSTARPANRKTTNSPKKITSAKPKKTTKPLTEGNAKTSEKVVTSTKVAEGELKDLLKIKSDSFQFTDIREILRGKSLDIYAYLRHLAGESGVCKITHNNLMDILNISRPTLFKQSDWLEKLSLIEKQSVPGDHTGTSYIVHSLEDALPVSEALVGQIEIYVENIEKRT